MYEKASGQVFNKHKTSIFFSYNTKTSTRELIIKVAGAVICGSYEKYSDLLAWVGRSKYNTFRCINDRVWNKINS